VIFRTLSRSFSDGAYDADDARILQAELLQASADPQAFIRDLLVEPPAQPKPESIESDEARSAIARIYSRRARAILKQLAFRSFVWAATDLQRLRVTAALAHTRVELEAVALINVMMDVPEVAWRWFSIGPDEAGRRFFQEHQVRVREILKSFDPRKPTTGHRRRPNTPVSPASCAASPSKALNPASQSKWLSRSTKRHDRKASWCSPRCSYAFKNACFGLFCEAFLRWARTRSWLKEDYPASTRGWKPYGRYSVRGFRSLYGDGKPP